MARFENLCKLPQVVGAIDGCLIPIKRPIGPWGSSYYCYKGFYAILLLAIVDSEGYFRYTSSGLPGCVGDAAAWADCGMKRVIERGEFFNPDSVMEIGDLKVSPFLVGDSAFPLTHYMMKCYNGAPAEGTPNYRFNYSLIRTRRVVENAFGRLKARFRVLRLARISDKDFVPKIINVCCALHNIAQRSKDPFEGMWRRDDETEDEELQWPGDGHNTAASAIRNALRDHVFS